MAKQNYVLSESGTLDCGRNNTVPNIKMVGKNEKNNKDN